MREMRPEKAGGMITLGSYPIQHGLASMIHDAVALNNEIQGSGEFAERLLDSYMIEANGDSNGQVYAELLHPIALDIEFYWWWTRNTLAYTRNGVIHLNKRIDWTLGLMTQNLAHEECHPRGYQHPPRATLTWHQTVPYTVGEIVADICKQRSVR